MNYIKVYTPTGKEMVPATCDSCIENQGEDGCTYCNEYYPTTEGCWDYKYDGGKAK